LGDIVNTTVVVSVIITAAVQWPSAEKYSIIESSSWSPYAIWASGIGVSAPDPGNKPILPRTDVHPAEKRAR
jgi:hypothetical protein